MSACAGVAGLPWETLSRGHGEGQIRNSRGSWADGPGRASAVGRLEGILPEERGVELREDFSDPSPVVAAPARGGVRTFDVDLAAAALELADPSRDGDRKSTRLNSSH